ncbi:formylglycine-generating enzyme family protein [Roseovarius sp. SYSU LYC5161]|uniref:formylglycine-generating enzyme family protein n=1 Tax=Roseovarius halophilus (ex Wu et al. 2025) TaxID=3376060 RepID=UPI00399B9002
MMTGFRTFLLACATSAALLLPSLSGAQQTGAPPAWDDELIDPAGGADLVLPLPCGGGMAFQRISVPVEADDPIADRGFRMGQSGESTGFSDYLRPAFLRGAFTDDEGTGSGGSHYYIARYEMNAAQYRALAGDCAAPFTRRDRFAQGGLSWFEAVDLSRRMTEWLMANAPDALPSQNGRTGFVRLPTEPEWEYATRGGARIDPTLFPGRRFFDAGKLTDYAHVQKAGQSRGRLRPVGLLAPNPAGLFDIYGNAEELMLEPFRLNAVGRAHGQVGGMVTRGGSIDTQPAGVYTAQRREYPMFSTRDGQALDSTFFGARFVIGAHVVSDAAYDTIRQEWRDRVDSETRQSEAEPQGLLAGLIEDEIDPRRKQALSDLQLEFRRAREAAANSMRQAARSTLISGAAFVETLIEDSRAIRQIELRIRTLRDQIGIAAGRQKKQLLAAFRNNIDQITTLREGRRTYLLSYRAALETLSQDVPPANLDRAYQTLTQGLVAAEQVDMLEMLRLFWADLETYRDMPDMSAPDLLTLAIGR